MLHASSWLLNEAKNCFFLLPDPDGHDPWQLPPGLPPERKALVTAIVNQQPEALQNSKVLNKEHEKFL